MKQAAYPYSAGDRLADPCSYMYTPLEGEAFFGHYFAARGAALDTWLEAMGPAGARDDLAVEILQLASRPLVSAMATDDPARHQPAATARLQPLLRALRAVAADAADARPAGHADPAAALTLLKAMDVGSALETHTLLKHLLSACCADQLLAEAPLKAWHDRLVQRFEVTKKLYTSYQPGFRKGTGSSVELDLYALLALFLALYSRRPDNLKSLNTLLKLGDLLCSLQDRVAADPAACAAASYALGLEVFHIGRWMKRRGLAHAPE
jgi:hypothetical protein